MNRIRIYFAIGAGIAGTIVLWAMGRMPLSVGWWAGVGIGWINFSTLLSSVERSRREVADKQKLTRSLRKRFFLRYVLLALAFFLVLRLGREQLGSSLIGFLSFYVVTFLDYMFRFRKRKPERD